MTRTIRPERAAAAVVLCLGVAAAHAQTAAKDSPTSPLRAMTPAEAQALNGTSAIKGRTTTTAPRIGMVTGKIDPQPIYYKNGTVEQELDASTMSYTVAQRNEDGSISFVCVTGTEAADKAMKAKPARTAARSTKEHQHADK